MLLVLTSCAQWGIFIAISLIIYGKAEAKALFAKIGQALFVLLGLYALVVLLSHVIVVPPIVNGANVPVEAKALTFFSGLSITGLIGMLALLFNLLAKRKAERITNALLFLLALFLFFMVYNLQKI